MSQDSLPLGTRPPQQARSRAALARILNSAEEVLLADGLDDFAMARVAQVAGVSVGAVYRRFAGRQELLDAVIDRTLTQLEEDLAESLKEFGQGGLADLVKAFTASLAGTLSAKRRVTVALLGHGSTASAARAGKSRETIQRLFLEAASAHREQIRHPDPQLAMMMTARTITGACIHRVASPTWWPEITWESWQAEITNMGTLYLTAEPS